MKFSEKYFDVYFKLIEVFSTFIIPIIIIWATGSFSFQIVTRPTEQLYSFAMAAFGVAAVLSGVCFTMAPSPSDTGPVRYAGEKFLHASLLMIQILLMFFIKQYLLDSSWGQYFYRMSGGVSVFLNIASILISTAAGWCWIWGFEALNDHLWKNWKERMAGTYVGEGPKREIIP